MPVTINRAVLELEAFANEHLVPHMSEEGRRYFQQAWGQAVESGEASAERLASIASSVVFLYGNDAGRLPVSLPFMLPAETREWMGRMLGTACRHCGNEISHDECATCQASRARQRQQRIEQVREALQQMDRGDADEATNAMLDSLVRQVTDALDEGRARLRRPPTRFVWSDHPSLASSNGHTYVCGFSSLGCTFTTLDQCNDCFNELVAHEGSCSYREVEERNAICADCGDEFYEDDGYFCGGDEAYLCPTCGPCDCCY